MPNAQTAATPTLPAAPPDAKRSLSTVLIWGLFAAVLVWSWQGAEMRPLDLLRDSGNIVTLTQDFFPPDFKEWRFYVEEMVATVHIAVWGTRSEERRVGKECVSTGRSRGSRV